MERNRQTDDGGEAAGETEHQIADQQPVDAGVHVQGLERVVHIRKEDTYGAEEAKIEFCRENCGNLKGLKLNV